MTTAFPKDVTQEITQLLSLSEKGDKHSLDLVVQKLYPELKKLAGIHSHSSSSLTLSATDILHDAYLKISKYDGSFNNRQHFLSVASKAMRQIIIDYARRKAALKLGGDLQRVEFDENQIACSKQAHELLTINQMLEHLEKINPKAAEVFECRFFGGMTDSETSEALDYPLRTVQREWKKAKVFLSGAWQEST